MILQPTEEQDVEPALDMAAVVRLTGRLHAKFGRYESDRRAQEQKWIRNLRQWLGQYDPEVESQLSPDRSRAYPKLTRWKVISMVARLMNLLFPVSEKNWALDASPMPNMPPEVLAEVADRVLAALDRAVLTGQPEEVDRILEQAIREEAKSRAGRLETTISDQLLELGGSQMQDYVTLCRQVLMSGVLYSMGVLKGPFVRTVQTSKWKRDPMSGVITVGIEEVYRPRFQAVRIWDYYPDMAAHNFAEMEGQFERHIMSRTQLRKAGARPDFIPGAVDAYLATHENGNYRRRTFEQEIRTIGTALNVNDGASGKFEAYEWTGFETAKTMAECGFPVPEGSAEVEVNVWFLDENTPIKAQLSPWVDLEPNERVRTYHHFVYEQDDTSIAGNGLPNVLRDSAMGVAAGARMILDNASITSGPNLEANLALLRGDQDLTGVTPNKIWYRDDEGPTAQFPAIREIKIDSHIPELKEVVDLFMNFADQESFVNPAMGGDIQKMSSEPFRSGTGASQIRAELGLPFKDAVRNFDNFTTSVIHSLVVFNRHFNDDPKIKGDVQVIARGSTSLVAKEQRGIALDQYVASLTEEEATYINGYDLALERAAARDLPIGTVLCTRDEAKQRDEAKAKARQADSEMQQRLIDATIREQVSGALKNLTQSDKNAAAAEAESALTTLEVLERGLGSDSAGGEGGSDGGAGKEGKSGGGGGNPPSGE